MDAPRVEGIKVGGTIGRGGSGKVFQVSYPSGEERAVKVFEDSAIDRALLERMTTRLEAGDWPAGVMPVLGGDFAAKAAYWMTPLLADAGPDGDFIPRNLQTTLDEHPGTDSWKLVKSLARALAAMHEREVVHGNLKPGNVFHGPDGGVLLSDWAMGNMPGVAKFRFTDAVLYQPPEQLRDPSGYATGAGYRWDVHAFGALSWRILTGRFPRCHETFAQVAPPSGAARREGIQADLGKIARNLESQPEVTWPHAARNSLEVGFRDLIARCLPLDPQKRPATMVEIAAGFAALEAEITGGEEREALLDQRRRAERRAWRTLFVAGAAMACAVVLGGLWQLTNSQLLSERKNHLAESATLRDSADAAARTESAAVAGMNEARHALAYERELALARLEASRGIGDRLFSWAMEKGNRRLPPLDGRDLRLKQLERYFEDFLTRTAEITDLADERARIRLQLAEIAIAAGDAPAASGRLGEALVAWDSREMDAELKFRFARDSLALALLRQSNDDPDAPASFVAARKALEAVPQADVDADRLNQLLAVLDFHEARILAANGKDSQALEQLMRATQSLNRIADQRPDAAVLRSELASCYLSSATILEGMGNLGDAREVRSLATVELEKLLKETPEDFALRLDLAGCYSAMAESAMLSADIAGAESLSAKAMELLDKLVVEQPDNAEAVSRKASQLGLRAGIQRDRGLAKEALAGYDEGIRMLEALHASAPDNALVSYRLALLWWQKGRMLGMGGDRPAEIDLIRRAADLLGRLEVARSATGPRPEQLQSSGAYLLGDLGHSLQLSDRKDEAQRAFKDAAALWENLLASRPRCEEYSEGLAWCRQRIDDLE